MDFRCLMAGLVERANKKPNSNITEAINLLMAFMIIKLKGVNSSFAKIVFATRVYLNF